MPEGHCCAAKNEEVSVISISVRNSTKEAADVDNGRSAKNLTPEQGSTPEQAFVSQDAMNDNSASIQAKNRTRKCPDSALPLMQP